jgi:hypothetical protein
VEGEEINTENLLTVLVLNFFLAFTFLFIAVFLFSFFSPYNYRITVISLSWSHSWDPTVYSVNAEVIFADGGALEQGVA